MPVLRMNNRDYHPINKDYNEVNQVLWFTALHAMAIDAGVYVEAMRQRLGALFAISDFSRHLIASPRHGTGCEAKSCGDIMADVLRGCVTT